MGWFATLDPALLIATTDRGDQLDLLVVPPSASVDAAWRAVTMAADPTNVRRAPDILLSTCAIAVPAAGTSADYGVWDNEGGRVPGDEPYPATTTHSHHPLGLRSAS
jgi:hypothetical protein